MKHGGKVIPGYENEGIFRSDLRTELRHAALGTWGAFRPLATLRKARLLALGGCRSRAAHCLRQYRQLASRASRAAPKGKRDPPVAGSWPGKNSAPLVDGIAVAVARRRCRRAACRAVEQPHVDDVETR